MFLQFLQFIENGRTTKQQNKGTEIEVCTGERLLNIHSILFIKEIWNNTKAFIWKFVTHRTVSFGSNQPVYPNTA